MANGFLDLNGTPMLMATGTNPMTVGTNGAGSLRLLSNGTERVTLDQYGNLTSLGRFKQKLTAVDVDAQNNTLSASQIASGLVVHTSATGAGTVTMDTAANIIAGSSGVGALTADGDTITVLYVNDGTQTLTFATATGVTIADTGQTVAADESVLVVIRRASSTTVTVYLIGA